MPEREVGPEIGPEVERESGRSRLVQAMARPSRSQAIVGVLLALVGFAGVTQIRTTEESAYAGLREQDLIDVLDGLAGTTQRTQAEIDRLTQVREELSSESTRRRAALERSREEADSLSVLAGLVPVTGPGVRVTIEELTGAVKVATFLDVIQELRSVGAEAIQVNGAVRLVAQSSFEEAAGGILVDGELLEPPYVIDAIGDSTSLLGAMVFAYGPKRTVRSDGGELTPEEVPSLDITTVRERVQPEYAQPDS